MSSAQCIPAVVVEQAAPNASAPDTGATQLSWKAFPAGTGAPTTQTRPLLQMESAPDVAYPVGSRVSAFVVSSVPQKLMGQTPPPMASAAQ